MKLLVEFLHDALEERAVAVPILDEDDQRFFGEARRVLGPEFVRPVWMHRHSHPSDVWRRSPCASLNRRDEHFAYTSALTANVTKPARGLEHLRVRLAVCVPNVPAILELGQNAIQPLKSVRIVRGADVNRDAQRYYSGGRLARRMARISS